ncbi:hypothetical protein AGLY_014102 [Aphis glycines]|uniref:Uncharacterized protein n=1 Tax=Aphis glycines TaxID=307491 RepID=A0A6G0T5E5_APHGL|nr:hypothetical protein AGLY_014102 [Aphis glycines]
MWLNVQLHKLELNYFHHHSSPHQPYFKYTFYYYFLVVASTYLSIQAFLKAVYAKHKLIKLLFLFFKYFTVDLLLRSPDKTGDCSLDFSNSSNTDIFLSEKIPITYYIHSDGSNCSNPEPNRTEPNRTLDVRFDSKFKLGMKKIRTELSNIFYCSKIELKNICRTRLTGHDSSKTKYLYNSSKVDRYKIHDKNCVDEKKKCSVYLLRSSIIEFTYFFFWKTPTIEETIVSHYSVSLSKSQDVNIKTLYYVVLCHYSIFSEYVANGFLCGHIKSEKVTYNKMCHQNVIVSVSYLPTQQLFGSWILFSNNYKLIISTNLSKSSIIVNNNLFNLLTSYSMNNLIPTKIMIKIARLALQVFIDIIQSKYSATFNAIINIQQHKPSPR